MPEATQHKSRSARMEIQGSSLCASSSTLGRVPRTNKIGSCLETLRVGEGRKKCKVQWDKGLERETRHSLGEAEIRDFVQ